jgi:hypothetical protein
MAPPRRRAAKKVREKFEQVPDLFGRVRDLLRRDAGTPNVAPTLTIFNECPPLRDGAAAPFSPQKGRGKTVGV